MYTIQNEGRRLQISGNITGDVIYIPKSKASVWAVENKVLIEYYYNEKSRPIDRQIWYGLYSDVSYPHTSSAQELKNIINEMITGANTVSVIIKVDTSDFDGNDFQDDRLIGKAADTGFCVYGDGGAGVLLEEGSGYDFDSDTGTITIDDDKGGPTKLRIVIA